MAMRNKDKSTAKRNSQQYKGGKGYKSKSPYKSSKLKDERQMQEIEDTAKSNERDYRSKKNDVAWYSKYPQMVKDVASYPFGEALGRPFGLDNGDVQIAGQTTVPGVMALHFAPCYGKSNDLTSPLNMAAANLYTEMRRKQSGSTNYDAADLMMYVLTMDSMFMFHSWMRRVYGVARLYYYMNRYYPDTIMKAMGVDGANIQQNLAQLRYIINTTAVKMSSFCVPKDFTLFDRHQWMCEGIYKDGMGPKAQSYIFVPDGFFVYTNTAETGTKLVFDDTMMQQGYASVPGSLATVNQTGVAITVDAISDFANKLINAVIIDDDFNTMSGDLLKAFGVAGVKMLPLTDEDFMVEPTYSQEVLSQIENATFEGYPADGGWDITQNPTVNNGAIIANPTFNATKTPATGYSFGVNPSTAAMNRLINMHVDDVTPEHMMVATRLSTISAIDESGGFVVQTCGSEVCTYYLILKNDFTNFGVGGVDFSNPHNWQVYGYLGGTSTAIDGKNSWYEQYMMCQIAQFDWAPIIYVAQTYDQGEEKGLIGIVTFLGDLDNYTTMNVDNLKKIHEVALLSMLYVPRIER